MGACLPSGCAPPRTGKIPPDRTRFGPVLGVGEILVIRFANLVGRERVIASADCGLGGRIHPQIAWGKLEALAASAALATSQLWH
jgi:hypothetical protein